MLGNLQLNAEHMLEAMLEPMNTPCCAELPASLWRCIYRHINNQREICTAMRVCKMLKAVLPELLTNIKLNNRASLIGLPTIQAKFGNHLILLEIWVTSRDEDDNTFLLGDADLVNLSFPHLRELRLSNNITDKLVFDTAYYPQLRKLFVGRNSETRLIQGLSLQLPYLRTLELAGIIVERFSQLAECLSILACPRLRSIRIAHTLSRQTGAQEMLVDLPWLERFKVEASSVTHLQLRAPRLMDLQLVCCSQLQSAVLLPDGELLGEDVAADAADAEVAVLGGYVGVDESLIANGIAMWTSCTGRAHVPLPAVQPRAPCSTKRIDLMIWDLRNWRSSQGLCSLVRDPRIRHIRDGIDFRPAGDRSNSDDEDSGPEGSESEESEWEEEEDPDVAEAYLRSR